MVPLLWKAPFGTFIFRVYLRLRLLGLKWFSFLCICPFCLICLVLSIVMVECDFCHLELNRPMACNGIFSHTLLKRPTKMLSALGQTNTDKNVKWNRFNAAFISLLYHKAILSLLYLYSTFKYCKHCWPKCWTNEGIEHRTTHRFIP